MPVINRICRVNPLAKYLPWLLIRFRSFFLPNFDPIKKISVTTNLVGNRPLLQTLLLTL